MCPLILAVLLLCPAARAESFQAWAARGARAEKRGDDRAALEAYSNALSSWKDGDGALPRAKAYCARAALRERGGDDDGALEDYTACLDFDKKNPKVWDKRGRLRLKAGRAASAISDFYKAVALDIGYGPAYYDRARAYELQGDKAFAREDYRRACELGVDAACAKAGRKKKKAGDAPAPKRASSAAETAACRDAAQACADAGATFGDCVAKAPSCERSPAKGCCPASCSKAMHKALDAGLADAAAFRGVFAGPRCTVPAAPPPEPAK
jgi:tetratricopeptide (TPR) repeat protein